MQNDDGGSKKRRRVLTPEEREEKRQAREKRVLDQIERAAKNDPEGAKRRLLRFKFDEFLRSSNHEGFLAFYRQEKELVFGSPQMAPGALRLLTDASAVEEAEELITVVAKTPKMVTEPLFASLARLYASTASADKALKMIEVMRSAGLEPRRRTFKHIANACSQVFTSAEEIPKIEALFKDMKETVAKEDGMLYPTEENYLEFLNCYLAMARAHAAKGEDEMTLRAIESFDGILEETFEDVLIPGDEIVQSCLERFRLDPKYSWTVTTDVHVDHASSLCKCCGTKLQPKDIGPEALAELIAQVDTIPEKLLGKLSKPIASAWAFVKDFTSRNKGAVKYIVDGANVAFKGSNPPKFSFSILFDVVNKLPHAGNACVVVIHENNFNPKRMTPEDHTALVELKKIANVIRVPHGANDDWFWLFLALNLSGSVKLVSNDIMRDHAFELLQPRTFQRWKDRHQTFFEFRRGWTSAQDLQLIEPLPYSRRAQILDCEVQGAEAAKSFHFVNPASLEPILAADAVDSGKVAHVKQRELDPLKPVNWICVVPTLRPTAAE